MKLTINQMHRLPMHKFILLLIAVSLGGVATAHHGLDTYNTARPVELDGKVISFRLLDPHSILVVETTNNDGTVSVWEVEGGPGSGIVQSGITREFLRSGPAVHIRAFQTRDGLCSPRCRAMGDNFDFDRN